MRTVIIHPIPGSAVPALRPALTAGLAPPLLGLALGLSACGSSPLEPTGGRTAPLVVAADGVLCDLTTRLAGPDLRVRCLLAPGDDPHQFRLTPAQKRDLTGASLVLINGYGLTPAVAALPGAVAIAELAVPESPQLPGPAQPLPPTSADHGHDDHGHHDHGNQDPHVWHDPRQASAMVRLVGERLARLAPTDAAAIRRRASTMTSLLAALDQWNGRQLATIPRDANGQAPPLASGHRAFTSLARRYGLRELAVVDGSSSSKSLRPQAFEAVVRQLKQERVPILFAEQQPAPRNLERISALSGVPMAAEPLLADGLAAGSDGDGDLMLTLTGNTCAIAEGLGGQCDREGQRQLIRQWEAIR